MEVIDIRHGSAADLPQIPLPNRLENWLGTLSTQLLTILDRIASEGAGAWLVGGCVRDALSSDGFPRGDVDIATTLTPDEMFTLFPRAIDTGSRFGTVTLRCDEISAHDEGLFEATSLRTESTYGDGRRPDEVRFGLSLSEDLRRRDLTMNAMAVDVARRCLHDPFGGLEDLENGVLRAVGTASERIREDGLRILRAYRFIDDRSGGIRAVNSDLASALTEWSHCIDNVAIERIWQEMVKIFTGASAGPVLGRMSEDGLLARICGDGLAPASCCGNNPSSIPGLDEHGLLIGRLAALHAPLPLEEVEFRLRALTAPRRVISKVCAVHSTLGKDPDIDSMPDLRLFRTALGELLPARILAMTGKDPESAAEIAFSISNLPPLMAGEEPLVDGHSLIAATGIPQGERLGRLKSWLHRQQITLDLPNSEAVMATLSGIDWEGGDPKDWPMVNWS